MVIVGYGLMYSSVSKVLGHAIEIMKVKFLNKS